MLFNFSQCFLSVMENEEELNEAVQFLHNESMLLITLKNCFICIQM